ncbi:MAG: hypothetical protein FWE03_00245 [Firmicutes bacterium]|nr:hypothetical protein [Bacillota bacterium]
MQTNQLQEWVNSGDTAPLILKDSTVIRIPKDKDFDYLFTQRHYSRGGLIERDRKFEYGGIIRKSDNALYDLQYDLREYDEIKGELSAEKLKDEMQGLVRMFIEKTINNDRKNLRIKEISDKRSLEQLGYYIQYDAYKDARQLYLENDGGEARGFVYKNDYRADAWKEATLLEYILDPTKYVATQAAEYMRDRQEQMLDKFLRADAMYAEYAKILATPENNIHTLLKIRKGLSTVSAKQVTITMIVGEKELTFKYDAQRLTWDCENKFSSYGADRDGRDKLEEAMGRGCNDFCPKSIVRINYGRNTLYEA